MNIDNNTPAAAAAETDARNIDSTEMELIANLNAPTVLGLIKALQALPKEVQAQKWGGLSSLVPNKDSLLESVEADAVEYDTVVTFFEPEDYKQLSLDLMFDKANGIVSIYECSSVQLVESCVKNIFNLRRQLDAQVQHTKKLNKQLSVLEAQHKRLSKKVKSKARNKNK